MSVCDWNEVFLSAFDLHHSSLERNGKKLDRRFDSEDTLALVRAFLIVHFDEKRLDIKNFSLVGHYPKCEFGEEQANLTLEEANLAPQAVLLVIDLDS